MCPIQSKKQSPTAVPATKQKFDEDIDLWSDDEATSTVVKADEMFPGQKNGLEETQKRLEAANLNWESSYSDGKTVSPSTKDTEKKMRKSVSFSHPSSWVHVSEDPELSEALKAARSSDFSRRKADLARLERTLAPILDPGHREKVYQRLYGSDAKDSY